MTTSADSETQGQGDRPRAKHATLEIARRFVRFGFVRELFVVLAFCLFTSILTWPYVTRLRDVVVDTGDPYLITWILWWDYHQTFTDPLHLFNANLFYPLKYTLAFSEHSYGIALLFFPLYALGVKPLTVHAIAMFFGFALSGYGAFRLGRTLTGSAAVGWVAGIVFGFVPYRFHLMSQVAYLFSPWIPLVFEALVLFARERSRARAVWLGCAFFMSGLTTISWFTFTVVPFALYAAILLTRYGLWREREFWRRGTVALSAAILALLPFLLPYLMVYRLYGFKRRVEEIQVESAWPIHWLSVESRNKLWSRMGDSIPQGWKFKLFPGLLPILFSVAAFTLGGRTAPAESRTMAPRDPASLPSRWLRLLDILIIIVFGVSILAVGFDRTNAFHGLFDNISSERALTLLTIAVVVRLCVAYPRFLPAARANLVETLRSEHRGDAFWLGGLLTVIGFCFSLGWNFFFFRICYELIPMFKSMRVASRGAMLAYLGLALLSGLGVKSLTESLRTRFPRLRAGGIFAVACALLLIEFNAAPLRTVRGEPFADAVTLRLKQTPMRGGIVELPAGGDFNYRYILRSADHQKPLIVGTSGFNSPIEDKIEALTRAGAIPTELLDLLEAVPASYLVIENQSIVPERISDYEEFSARGMASGRLRFINRFGGHSDLYAVVKTEPGAESEAALPFNAAIRDWASRLQEDPINLLGASVKRSQLLYRVFLASTGTTPRYAEFVRDLEVLGRGVMSGVKEEEKLFQTNLGRFLDEWVRRASFTATFGPLNNQQYVDRLLQNAGARIDPSQRAALISGLESGQDTRAGVLLKIVDDPVLVEKESNRSLLLLHYFGYLRRNPGEPPDRDLSGYDFWLRDLETNHTPAKLSSAFKDSIEYGQIKGRR